VSPVWYAVALLGWGAVDGVLVLLNVLAGGAVPPAPPLSTWLSLPAVFLVTALLRGGLDEEVGWRGLALPRLQARYGALPASLLLGLIWAAWHLPLWFIPGQGQAEQSFPVFVLSVLLLSVVLAWLYNSTGGSLLIVVLAHAANNVTFRVFGQAVSALPPEAVRLSPLVGDVLLPVAVVALLAILTDPRTLTRKTPRRDIRLPERVETAPL
jgi:membrane protease YdiL (CAAX protease family)